MKRKALTLCLGVLLTLSLSACQEGYHLGHLHDSNNDVTVEQPPEGGDVHTHEYTDTVVDPTCTEDGYTIHTCECGETYTDTYVSALGHDVTEWTSVEGDDAYHYGTCSVCLETVSEPHNYTSSVVDQTCTEDGSTTYTCSDCGYSYVEVTLKTGHDWGEWTSDVDETTGEDAGTHTRTCKICGEEETVPHIYTSVYTAPTCTEGGYVTHTCDDCEATYIDGEVDALGHAIYTWTDNSDGTTHSGSCEREGCDYTETEEHHMYYSIDSDATNDTDGGTHTYKCAYCDYVDPNKTKVAHTDTNEDGFCDDCGAVVESETIEQPFVYELNDDSSSYTITGVSSDYTGTELVIPNQHEGYPVTAIADRAFNKTGGALLSYTKIIIPESVETIGSEAFAYCTSLTTLIFEGAEHGTSNLTTIGAKAFYDCYSLESVTIPKSVTSIGDNAFAFCNVLTSIVFEHGSQIESIGEMAFYQPYELATLDFGATTTLTSIGASAFSCPNDENNGARTNHLAEITIPNSVTSLGSSAFYGCREAVVITFEEGTQLSEISNSAFHGAESLLSFTIPNSVTTIGLSAFNGCNSLETLTFEEESKVTSIGNYAFYLCYSLKELTIPNSVTSIGTYAFFNGRDDETLGYSSLTSLTLSENLTTIESYAFCNCRRLTEVTIPSGVTSIGDYAFYNCTSLKSITIPSGVTSIGTYAFYNCTSLKSITIPASVTSIGAQCFRQCNSLESITFEEDSQLTSIGQSAFYNCYALEKLTIPDSVTTMGTYVFRYCESLTSLTLSSSLTSISNYTFYHCESLEELEIPASVTSIGADAFSYCYSLTSLTFEENSQLETIGEDAFDYSALSEVTIPASVTSIGAWAFGDAQYLTKFVVEGSEDETSQLTTLGAVFACNNNQGYYGCLEEVVLPGSITTVEADGSWYLFTNAFTNSSESAHIDFYGTEEQWEAFTSLGEIPEYVTINYLG